MTDPFRCEGCHEPETFCGACELDVDKYGNTEFEFRNTGNKSGEKEAMTAHKYATEIHLWAEDTEKWLPQYWSSSSGWLPHMHPDWHPYARWRLVLREWANS